MKKQITILTLLATVNGMFSKKKENEVIRKKKEESKNYIVKMKNFVFDPEILIVNPGDTIIFVPDPSGHYSQSLDYEISDGIKKGWKTEWGKKESIALKKPGFYCYICPPHQMLGMVGLIIVKGEDMYDNFDEAKEETINKRTFPKEIEAWKNIWEKVENMIAEGKLNKKKNN